jgi:xanthine dehydrogenase molybdenum-binding subunit
VQTKAVPLTVVLAQEKRSFVGTSFARVDAVEKVTGSVQYAVDLKFPDMLHAALLHSPHPHAQILSIDTRKAEQIPGVKAVISRDNAPRFLFNSSCPLLETGGDQVIFDDYVRYVGDPVAAVAAVDIDTARTALASIQVTYKILPFTLSAEAAIAQEAPRVREKGSNIAFENGTNQESEDFDRAIAESDYVFRGKYSTTSVQQCAMEPHVCVSKFDDSGKLTVWSSTQIPFRLRNTLSKALGLPVGKVRIIRPPLGGGFGAKEQMTVEPYTAVLAMKTRKPVKLEYTREEEFTVGSRRHAFIVELETGVSKTGVFTARGGKAILQAGAYLSHGPGVLSKAFAHFLMLYKAAATRFDGKCVYTNTSFGGACRGYGAPQIVFAIERQVDEICRELGYDPIEFRISNSYTKGDIDPVTNWKIESGASEASIRQAAEKVGWNNRLSIKTLGDMRRGIGFARYMYSTGAKPWWPECSEALAIVNEDGSVNVVTSAVDLGTGITTGFAQIAAEELQINADMVNISKESDTETFPMDSGAYASRTTYVAGGAVKLAAADARQHLLSAASRILGVELDRLDTENGNVYSKIDPGKRISYGDIVRKCRTALEGSSTILGRGFFEPRGNGPTFGAQFAEVEVDVKTGQTKVLRLVAALDVGKAINPANIEGQVQGSIQMGVGYALSEYLQWNAQSGEIMNPSFLDYKLIAAPDMPKVDVIILESPDPFGPYGAKGVGEQAVVPTAAAVLNAINDAVGVSIRDLPATSEKVYRVISTPKPRQFLVTH